MIKHLLAATAALTLVGAAAHAQTAATSAPPSSTPDAGPAPMDSTATGTMSAASPGASSDTSATGAMAPSAANSTDASAVVSVNTVTNGPVADTPANRAKYGQPLSRAGRRTAAKGN